MNALSALTALSSFVGRQTGSEPVAHARSSSSSVGCLLAVGKWRSGALPPPPDMECGSERKLLRQEKKKKEETETRNLLNR